MMKHAVVAGYADPINLINGKELICHICQRARQIQKDLYLCSPDYIKSSDRVRHNELIKILEMLDNCGHMK